MEGDFERIAAGLAGGAEVALWGAGVSTAAAARLFAKFGVSCRTYSDAPGGEPFDASAAGRHRLAVYSPAFRPSHPFFRAAESAGVRTMGEPDLAGLFWQGRIIAVSGTNGKTTLTSFLAHALNSAGIPAVAAGNIGTPLCEFAPGGEGVTAVCELSSFQGMRLESLRPDAFAWTNFAPDHLDWHADMREYFLAKLNIARRMRGRTLVAGSGIREAAEEFGAALPEFAEFTEDAQYPAAPAPFDNSVQRENFALASALWRKLGLDGEILLRAAEGFSLPPHRLAKCAQIGGVSFWNDSKATNAHAAIAALRELKTRRPFWIGGGKDKFCDDSALVRAVAECARGAALIGQTAETLKPKLQGLELGAHTCPDMAAAVELAFKKCGDFGDILFSPGYSSFGMFKSYADRGKSFEEAVLCLKNKKNSK